MAGGRGCRRDSAGKGFHIPLEQRRYRAISSLLGVSLVRSTLSLICFTVLFCLQVPCTLTHTLTHLRTDMNATIPQQQQQRLERIRENSTRFPLFPARLCAIVGLFLRVGGTDRFECTSLRVVTFMRCNKQTNKKKKQPELFRASFLFTFSSSRFLFFTSHLHRLLFSVLPYFVVDAPKALCTPT